MPQGEEKTSLKQGSVEKKWIINLLEKERERVEEHYGEVTNAYWKHEMNRIDLKSIAKHFTKKTGVRISTHFIYRWLYDRGYIDSDVCAPASYILEAMLELDTRLSNFSKYSKAMMRELRRDLDNSLAEEYNAYEDEKVELTSDIGLI